LKKLINVQYFENHIRQNKKVFILFTILRISVIFVLIRSLFLKNYEGVGISAFVLFLFLMPAILEKNFRVDIPPLFECIIYAFIYAAEILGEIDHFYVAIPGWDTMLHTLNGFLCAAVGFSLIDLLNQSSVKINLSPLYLALCAFCFSMTVGVCWEFIECAGDLFFGQDMQKDFVVTSFNSVSLDPTHQQQVVHVNNITDTVIHTASGKTYTIEGGYLDIGILDTMKDLFVNFIGALVFSIFGYYYDKNHAKKELNSTSDKIVDGLLVRSENGINKYDMSNHYSGQNGTEDGEHLNVPGKEKHAFKLMAVDMDGTLLNSKKEVTPKTANAIQTATDEGKYIVFSTGRCISEMKPYADVLSMMRYGVLESGALLYDFTEKKVLYKKTVPKSETEIVLNFVKDYDVMFLVFLDGQSFIGEREINHLEDYQMGVYKTLYDEVTEQVSDMREFILSKAGELEKINIYFRSRKERQEVFEKMRGLPLSMAYSEQTSLEVSPASTTKGTGLSIAVANAKQQVLKISDVVVSDNDHDGVAEAIERYLC